MYVCKADTQHPATLFMHVHSSIYAIPLIYAHRDCCLSHRDSDCDSNQLCWRVDRAGHPHAGSTMGKHTPQHHVMPSCCALFTLPLVGAAAVWWEVLDMEMRRHPAWMVMNQQAHPQQDWTDDVTSTGVVSHPYIIHSVGGVQGPSNVEAPCSN